MFEGFILKLPHGTVRSVDRCFYSRAIAVFGLNGVRQARVAGAQFEFQRPFAHRKAPLTLVHPRLLCRIEVQLVMQEGLEFVFARCRRCRSEESRGGKECGRSCRHWWSP